MIDTHAHIHDKAFDEDRDAVVERMRASGVEQAVIVGCDIGDSRRALAAANAYHLYASVGIHPHEAKDAPADIDAAFAPFFGESAVVAVGETGLDYYYEHSARDVQRRVLCAQISVARERNLPVIFHHRDAFADFSSILREQWRMGMRGVVHCFTGDSAQAATYVDEFGLLLGIGGVVTFKSAQSVRQAVIDVGIERLVLETDCPYLAPVPHRGARNEPAYVTATAARVAQLLGLSVVEVAASTDANARRLFNLPR